MLSENVATLSCKWIYGVPSSYCRSRSRLCISTLLPLPASIWYRHATFTHLHGPSKLTRSIEWWGGGWNCEWVLEGTQRNRHDGEKSSGRRIWATAGEYRSWGKQVLEQSQEEWGRKEGIRSVHWRAVCRASALSLPQKHSTSSQ